MRKHSLTIMASIVVLVVAGFVGLETAASTGGGSVNENLGTGSEPDGMPIYHASNMTEEEVLLTGTPGNEGCVFDAFGVRLSGPGSVQLEADENCGLIVNSVEVTVTPTDPCGQRTVHGHAWMYGWAGPWDKLTKKDGWLTFSYCHGIAWMTHQEGKCSRSFSHWKFDACVLLESESYSYEVWRKGRGDFHCDLGSAPCSEPTYYHSLFDKEIGYPNGQYECDAYYEGHIVLGFFATCGEQ